MLLFNISCATVEKKQETKTKNSLEEVDPCDDPNTKEDLKKVLCY